MQSAYLLRLIFGRNEPTILTHILLYIKFHFNANKNAPFLALFSMNFLKRRFFAVEPFGLFQILNSFLNQNPKNAPQAESGDTDESENRLDRLDQSTQKSNAEPEKEMEADSSNQAFLSFMQAHETRAKRIKKP